MVFFLCIKWYDIYSKTRSNERNEVPLVIDIHTHIFPDKIAEDTISLLEERAHLHANTRGSMKELLTSMKRGGVGLSVVQPIATSVKSMKSINNFAAQTNSHASLLSFGSIHPQAEDWREELKRIKELGLPGIKFHPNYQGFVASQPEIADIVNFAAELGLIVLFHAGEDVGLPDTVSSTPADFVKLLERTKGANIILAHMGGWNLWNEVEQHLIGRDVYLDTSFTITRTGMEQFKRMVQNHNPDKILFGTDSPWQSQLKSVESIRACGFDSALTDAILYRNAASLLRLE